MKRLKNILIILLTIVICVIAFYFIWGMFRFTSIKSLQELAHTTYISRDGNSYIVFNDLKRIVICLNEDYYYLDESTLQVNENVLSFEEDEIIYHFALIEDDKIFSYNYNIYLYKKVGVDL